MPVLPEADMGGECGMCQLPEANWGDKLIVVRADDLHMVLLLAQEIEDRGNREELAVRRIGETLRREAK